MIRRTLPISILLAGSAILGSAPILPAQSAQTDFLVVGSPNATTGLGGGIFLVDATKHTSTPLKSLPATLRGATSIVADPSNTSAWFVGTNGKIKNVAGPANLYRILVAGGRVLRTTKLNSQPLTADIVIRALQLVGDRLVFGSETRVATIPAAGGKTTTLLTFFRSTNNFPAIASDGRYLYTNISNNNGWRTGGGSVWRFDLQDITKHVRLFSVDQFPTNIRGLAVDSNHRLLVVDKGNFAAPKLRQFDLTTHAKLHDVILPFQSLSGATFGAIDPNTETVVVLGLGKTFRDRQYHAVTVQAWKKPTTFYGSVSHPLTGAAARRTPGLVRRGFECASTLRPAPVNTATSTPNAGNNKYALNVIVKTGSIGILLVGAGGGLPNPIRLAPTKCELGVASVLALGGIAARNRIQQPLPIPAGTAGVSLDVQWAVLDPSANNLGIVTTQVGRVWIR